MKLIYLWDRILGSKLGYRIQQSVVRKMTPGVIFGEWWPYPAGGQSRRIKKIIELIDSFKPDLIIETGTFIASTTPLLATLSRATVVTIEINPRLAHRNRELFRSRFPHLQIRQVIGSSEIELTKILGTTSKEVRVLAYLDAHWFDYLPVTDEITALSNWGGKFIAVIDDFKVEGDEGYGWDEYRSGHWIGQHLIPNRKNLTVFVPAQNSETEGMGRRGTAYVFGPNVISTENSIDLSGLRQI